ncbi:hypothetical protein LLG95_13055 [bacterium]|nr:hypothetical protein [bacterium]
MDQLPKKSAWIWVWRIAAGMFVVFALAILAGVAFLKTRPMPSANELAAADERYQKARALFPASAPETKSARVATSSTTTLDADSTAALQARADRLYRNIFEDNLGRGGFDVLAHGSDHKKILDHVDDARALAALYDKGVRVSPKLTRNFRLKHAPDVNAMANELSDDHNFKDVIEALKFMRVIDCPASGLPDRGQIQDHVSKVIGSNLQPLPAELMKLDLNLLAPRRPMDWQRCIGLQLDYAHDLRTATQELLDPAKAFHYTFALLNEELPNSWYKPFYVNGAGLYGAIVARPLYIAPTVNSRIVGEQVIQDYATAFSNHNAQDVQESVAIEMQRMNEQIKSRVIAGAIELRRGAPIPSPDQIRPDSYFFDPVTQRPYKLYVSRTNPNYVELHVRRPVVDGDGRKFEMDVYQFNLPANHPGLQGIPTL